MAIAVAVIIVGTGGCATVPPDNLGDVCAIFKEQRGWYKSAREAQDRWGVPIHVQMAIIYQESHFEPKARPPRYRFLGILPTFRPSSAFGYAQVKDDTWDWYVEQTGNGGADRDDFADAVDFIGWYGNLSQRRLKISRRDAYNQYLAYHEGQGGFANKTYRKKDWLIDAAHAVEANAKRYRAQLPACEDDLNRSWFWPF